MIKDLTLSEFKEAVLESKVPVLVEFWAEWCGPCHRMVPILEALKESLDSSANIFKVNCDIEDKLADRYQILSIPTIVIFQNGTIKKRLIGVQSLTTLRGALSL